MHVSDVYEKNLLNIGNVIREESDNSEEASQSSNDNSNAGQGVHPEMRDVVPEGNLP